jgi:AcrR family transcriptional regulator
VADKRVNVHQARAWATAKSKKRPRMSAAELRERILATAVEMLNKSGGLTVSLAHLNMEELIRIADVPRSSVYRAWESKEAFYVDLMEQMIKPTEAEGAAYDEETLRIVVKIVQEHADKLATPDGRRGVLREVVRLGVARNFDSVVQSLAWRSSTALIATLPALEGKDQQRILAALTRAETQFIDRLSDLYSAVLPILGLRIKQGFDTKVFTATVRSLIEGLTVRGLTNPAIVNPSIVQPGLDGEPAEWRLPAVGFLAILDAMSEPDPDFDAGAVHIDAAVERVSQIWADAGTPRKAG